MPEDQLLNVMQVRTLLGGDHVASRSWVYRLIQEGRLRAIRYGQVRGVRVYRSSVERYLRERRRDMAA